MKNNKFKNVELTKLIDSNRITLPRRFIDFFNIKFGDFIYLELFPVEPLIVLKPVDIIPKQHDILLQVGEAISQNAGGFKPDYFRSKFSIELKK